MVAYDLKAEWWKRQADLLKLSSKWVKKNGKTKPTKNKQRQE